MSDQRHVIKRQILQVAVRRNQDAHTLTADVSRVYRQRIIPLIDRYCTELSAPDRLHRIESLDVDLGTVDAHNLEEDFLVKAGPALRKALAVQIRAQEQADASSDRTPHTQSQLELLASFARTGSLPWWADRAQPTLLDTCLQHLLANAPDALHRLLKQFTQEPHSLRRITRQFNDEQLARLAGLLVPHLEATCVRDATTWLVLLQASQVAPSSSRARLRHDFWYTVLSVAGGSGWHYGTQESWYRAVLKRMAVEMGVLSDALMADIQRIVQTDRPDIPAAFKELWDGITRHSSLEMPSVGDEIDAQVARCVALGGVLGDMAASLRPLLLQLPHRDQAEGLALLRHALAQWPVRKSIDPQTLHRLETLCSALQQTEPYEGQQLATRSRSARDLDSRFSDADEVSIDNAGLVVLWPFLSHFFGHVGLLEEKQFKDAAARQRAVGLLQYLATGDVSFPEYLLPLNKVLCGMEVTEVFDFGEPLAEAETEECTNLLHAVIAQAPILRDMSPTGFRGSFLLRRGMLSTRDGAWLLRVERETYDVVLDRFPWTIQWVKLPWMDAPLRVEW